MIVCMLLCDANFVGAVLLNYERLTHADEDRASIISFKERGKASRAHPNERLTAYSTIRLKLSYTDSNKVVGTGNGGIGKT